MDVQLAPPDRRADLFGEDPMVWRLWRVAPDASGSPILKGLLGFPWPTRVLEARCLALDPLAGDGRYRGRFHRSVPALGCTCGIYGRSWDMDPVPLPRTRRREPMIEGFVSFSGRIVRDPAVIRAERAEVVGPLLLHRGRGPWLQSLTRRRPSGVRTRVDRYEVVWQRHPDSTERRELEPIAEELAQRYGCAVMVGGQST